VVPVGVTTYPSPTPADVEVIETPVSEITHTITETLTYTVGTGENAHPTTTEITSTSTETIYKTMTITKDHASPTGAYEAGEEITGTTTLLTTSTTTKYITVHPTPSKGAVESEVPSDSYPTGPAAPPSNEEGECKPQPPVTVTVTNQETVTVTVGQETPIATPASSAAVVTEAPVPSSSAAVESEIPVPTSYVTVPVIPYPAGNGTGAYPTAPTGFVTATKPYSTGEVPVASSSLPADSELPSFTLPAEGNDVSSTAYPIPESSAAVPTAVPSDSYGPGYRKRFSLF
jgi:hypothetical protein